MSELHLDGLSITDRNEIHSEVTHKEKAEEEMSVNDKSEINKKESQNGKGDAKEKALDYYLRASEFEKEGRLNDAMEFYRLAFLLYEDVEKLLVYENVEMERVDEKERLKDKQAQSLEQEKEVSILKSNVILHKSLSKKIQISSIPSDLIILILSFTNAKTIKRCSLTCRYLYWIAKEKELWSILCTLELKNINLELCKQTICIQSLKSYLKQFKVNYEKIKELNVNYDFYKLYFTKNRVNLRGIYVCIIRYIRPGANENTFCQPVHLITYYRYLKFFPLNMVKSFTSTDPPEIAVKKMMKGGIEDMRNGNYYYHAKFLYIAIEAPKSQKSKSLTFRIKLKLESAKLRWIEFHSYDIATNQMSPMNADLSPFKLNREE